MSSLHKLEHACRGRACSFVVRSPPVQVYQERLSEAVAIWQKPSLSDRGGCSILFPMLALSSFLIKIDSQWARAAARWLFSMFTWTSQKNHRFNFKSKIAIAQIWCLQCSPSLDVPQFRNPQATFHLYLHLIQVYLRITTTTNYSTPPQPHFHH